MGSEIQTEHAYRSANLEAQRREDALRILRRIQIIKDSVNFIPEACPAHFSLLIEFGLYQFLE